MNANYALIPAVENDLSAIIEYKLKSILEYAPNLNEEEKEKIKSYVLKTTPIQLKEYKCINVENKRIGCILITNYKDGILLDEIYIEENYRNKKIGSSIIKDIIKKYNKVYLWVYKENKIAIELYKKLGFEILEETENRLFMNYKKR